MDPKPLMSARMRYEDEDIVFYCFQCALSQHWVDTVGLARRLVSGEVEVEQVRTGSEDRRLSGSSFL